MKHGGKLPNFNGLDHDFRDFFRIGAMNGGYLPHSRGLSLFSVL